MSIDRNFRRRGFSLLEVLIAVVVLSFGLLALANLQASLMRNSSDAKARSVGLSLAKDRVEQLRSYSSISDYEAITDSAATIADVGGSLGGVSYTVTTVVSRFAYNPDPDGDPDTDDGEFQAVASDTGALAADFQASNEFKTVQVTVGWTDEQGVAQSVVVEDAIGAIAPENSGRLARRKADNVVRKPVVLIQDPSLDAGVIPIAIGDDAETAATNPRPVLDTETAQTSFDVFTYAALQDGSGNAQAQARVETRVIGCRCDFGEADADRTAYRPTYWNGERYVAPKAATAPPLAGEANLTGGDPTQSILCTACCSDHHDPAGVSGPKFSPRRDSHDHYDDILADPVTSGEYWEACRMIRVDGIFRVASDPYNEYTNVLKTAIAAGETEPFTDPSPDATASDNYVDFVVDYLSTQGLQSDPNDQLAQDVADAKAETAGLNVDPEEVELGQERWMHARGLYIDWLEAEAKNAITESQVECADGLTSQECLLRVLPFTSINVTELSSWSPLVQDTAAELYVANDDFALSELALEGDQFPVRGRVTPRAQGIRDAVASMNTGTVGLLAKLDFAVNPTDTQVQTNNIADQPDEDGQTFEITGPACGVGRDDDNPVPLTRNGAPLLLVTGVCEGSDPAIATTSTRVRLRLSVGVGPSAASVTLTGPGLQEYVIPTTDWSSLDGTHTFTATGDPTAAGPWTLTLTSNHSTGATVDTAVGFSVDFLYSEGFTVELAGYDFGDNPSLGAPSVTCDPIQASNNPTDCETVNPDVSTTAVLTRYNYEYVGSSRSVACPNSQTCPTDKYCKNFRVASVSVNGVSVVPNASTSDGRSNESTEIPLVAGLSQGDVVVVSLGAEGELDPVCSHGNGSTTRCSNYSFSCAE